VRPLIKAIPFLGLLFFYTTAYAVNPGDWQSYSPTWTNLTIGNGTNIFKYTQIGQTIHVEMGFIRGSSGSESGELKFSLPQTASISNSAWTSGTTTLFDTSTGKIYTGYVTLTSSTQGAFRLYQNNTGTEITGNTVNATVPFTWATGDVITATFTYETTAPTNYLASSSDSYLSEEQFWDLENKKAAGSVFSLSFVTLLFGTWIFYHKARY